MIETLDLHEIAQEWRERIEEMSASVPDTEGMSWGEVADATTAFLAEPEQLEYVAAYVDLCNELGITPVEPDTLDWWADNHEATLIAESSFTAYAQEVAEDIGAVNSEAGWPVSYIDWDAAADALRMDYTAVEYDGTTYLTRS